MEGHSGGGGGAGVCDVLGIELAQGGEFGAEQGDAWGLGQTLGRFEVGLVENEEGLEEGGRRATEHHTRTQAEVPVGVIAIARSRVAIETMHTSVTFPSAKGSRLRPPSGASAAWSGCSSAVPSSNKIETHRPEGAETRRFTALLPEDNGHTASTAGKDSSGLDTLGAASGAVPAKYLCLRLIRPRPDHRELTQGAVLNAIYRQLS